MKVIFIDWICYGRRDVLEALRGLGHTVILYPVEIEDEDDTAEYNMDYIVLLMKEIEKQNISFVFSMNYFTSVSEACYNKGIPYISWIYDNPYSRAYGISITNHCNYIFTFNRHTYLQMQQKGL
ncbi:MAG: DUF3880 domain-containing protein, partial [Lachnoclostridium sp.]|nr:DUF3880 domain-containing protein [Lachnoclostridium sp.]